MLDIKKIRQDFPILSQIFHGKRLVYLDNAATSQKPQLVIDRISQFYSRENANVHRGIYQLSEKADQLYLQARKTVADFLHVETAEVIFTRNTTESLNLVAESYALNHLQEGDEIVLTDLEHHSNLLPWQRVAERTGARLIFLDTKDGELAITELKKINQKTKIVSVSYASNVTGSILPIEAISQQAKKFGALLCIDAAQAAPHLKIDLQTLNCSFLAFSGHKMLAPMGIGVLYANQAIQKEMIPYQLGGGMIEEVSYQKAQYLSGAEKFEAGTPNVAGAVALAEAIRYLSDIGFEEIHQHEQRLAEILLSGLTKIEGIHLVSQTEKRTTLFSFYSDYLHAHDLASLLDQEGIAIRAGYHCAMPYHLKNKLLPTARVSAYLYNTEAEIFYFLEKLKAIQKKFSTIQK